MSHKTKSPEERNRDLSESRLFVELRAERDAALKENGRLRQQLSDAGYDAVIISRRIGQLCEVVRQMLAQLKAREWGPSGDCCHTCYGGADGEPVYHEDDCQYAAAIRAAEEVL